MLDPYQILGIARDASEADVRRRYLELVRQFPPDRDGRRFTEIHQAYEKLRDPVARLESMLFDPGARETIADIVVEVRQRLRKSRIPTHTLLSLAEG